MAKKMFRREYDILPGVPLNTGKVSFTKSDLLMQSYTRVTRNIYIYASL